MFKQLFDTARQIRRSESFKYNVSTPRRLAILAGQHLNKPVFAVELRATSGFFSIIQTVLYILMYCEEKGLSPQISARGGAYGDEAGKIDWFSCYFDRVADPLLNDNTSMTRERRRVKSATITGVDVLGFRRRYGSLLDIKASNELFFRHYRLSKAIADEVDRNCIELNVSDKSLGVHYRGTDKDAEAEKSSWDRFCRDVDRVSKSRDNLKNIFLASDEHAFISYFQNWGFDKSITVAPAIHLSANGKPIHFSGLPGLEIGREALVTSLLLSRCGYLVKTASYLSGWSKVFCPQLPTLLVTKPHAHAWWFPDSVIWTEQERRSRHTANLTV